MNSPFDASAFAASIDGADCITTTMLTLQALQPGLTADASKAEALATALCGAPVSSDVGTSLNTSFLLTSGYLVFVMQAGFAMLCAGSVRSKNTMNILLKNLLDACVGAIAFYLFGFGFAFGGTNSGAFIGNSDFALKDTRSANDGGWASFLFQWAFSAAAATIVSGSVAERTTFVAYMCYSFFITGFVYPVIVHWIWSSRGWMSGFNGPDKLLFDMGVIDFAGSGVVHAVGGTAGLMGAILVGPRMGRFDADGKPNPIRGHSASLIVLGTFLLWFGWYGFNPGSQLVVAGAGNAAIVGRTAVTTTLAGASGGVFALLLTYIQTHTWDLVATCNGVLCGLVAITSGCSTVEPWAAIICGFLAAIVFNYADKLLLKLGVDDPLSAAPMHAGCGMLGVLFVGFFAYEPYVHEVYGDRPPHVGQGVLYGGHGRLLACQVVACLAIFAWVGGCMFAFFALFKFLGLLRVPPEEELAGLDTSKHGGSAYEMPQKDAIKTVDGEKPEI